MHLVHRNTSGPLPVSHFDLANAAGDVIGYAQLRHRPSQNADLPPEAANRIYYEIAEPHRGQGLGKALLGLLLDEARRIGLEHVRLTVTTANAVSRHIVESHGAVWLRGFVCKQGLTYQLYEIGQGTGPSASHFWTPYRAKASSTAPTMAATSRSRWARRRRRAARNSRTD